MLNCSSMKQRLILLPFLFCFTVPVLAQKEAASYPVDYFRDPLNIPIFLAGNFGECRPGHFHSGLDIKTLGKENEPVYAAADGYISRIKMDKGGFGHALYITHPNGYTTLYAHLNKFVPDVQAYMEHEQYDKQHWDVDMQLPPTQFPVKKGQQIAWSGNTGASTAPHLHFEIRDTRTEHPLNPQLFGLPLIDKIPPVPAEVTLFSGNVYASPAIYFPVAARGEYYMPVRSDQGGTSVTGDTILVPAGITGVGVNIDDFMDSSTNTITWYTAKLYMDDILQAQVTLDDIGYEETRYINAYIDYKSRQRLHKWVQCLFLLPGNQLTHIYSGLNKYKGRLDLTDNKVHKVTMIFTDARGNTSKVLFYVAPSQAAASIPVSGCTRFLAGKANKFSNDNVSFQLDERQLYDDICFTCKAAKGNAFSEKYTLHTAEVPLHHYFDLLLKPVKQIPARYVSKVVMRYTDGDDEDGRAAIADMGWYKAKVRNFGTYWLDIDTIPPAIKPLQRSHDLSHAKELAFEVKEAMTSVKKFSGYIDGAWTCFEQHGDRFFYSFDAHCPKGKHKLVFRAEDENGNERVYHFNFTR